VVYVEQHSIHRGDGAIMETHSYGNDPCPSKDS
jgi:hypothetical protein